MNVFSHCPKCKRPMLNEDQVGFDYRRNDITNFWKLSCSKNTDHEIIAYTDPDNSFTPVLDRLRIAISMPKSSNDGKYALWGFASKRLILLDGNLMPSSLLIARSSPINEIPFFIPNLSNYDKILEKLRLYTVLM